MNGNEVLIISVGLDEVAFEPTSPSLFESVYKQLVEEARIWFGKDGSSVPRKKTYLSEIEGMAAWSWWPNADVGHNQEAKKESNALFGVENAFETPKPERLLRSIIHLSTNPGDLILDSFAGSGTTAKFLCEPKATNEMTAEDVLAKAKAATEWCAYATAHERQHGSKPWTYLVIPHDAIADNKTLQGLAATYTHGGALSGKR